MKEISVTRILDFAAKNGEHDNCKGTYFIFEAIDKKINEMFRKHVSKRLYNLMLIDMSLLKKAKYKVCYDDGWNWRTHFNIYILYKDDKEIDRIYLTDQGEKYESK